MLKLYLTAFAYIGNYSYHWYDIRVLQKPYF